MTGNRDDQADGSLPSSDDHSTLSDDGEHSRSPETGSASSMRCEVCGTEVDPTGWHPVATRVDDNDEFHLYTFCSDECRRKWQANE
ncbi:DUF7576 family protein [Halobacterium zhouii]|uniref:DUF7576 family protein n=1 Tax=Halobacterium zhouii TaxID=2902624 RepID=UPI003D7A453B